MSLESNSDSIEQVLSLLNALEIEVCELSDIALQTGVAQIIVEENCPIDNLLAVELQALFQQIDNPARYSRAIDAIIRYDGATKLFTPSAASILLDNNLTIEFSQSAQMAHHGHYYMQVVDGAGMPIVPPVESKVGTFTLDEMRVILKGCGLDLPISVTEGWAALERVLQFSKKWQRTAQKTLILNPQRQLYISEMTEGGMAPTDNAQIQFSADEVWQRTLTISTDEAHLGEVLPRTSLQLMLTTNDKFEQPHYQDLSRVPLTYVYEDMSPMLIEFIENPTMLRKELTDKRRTVQPSLDLLHYLREIMLEARTSLEF